MFSSRIKEVRKSMALTQEEFGRVLGVERLTVTRWESGRNMPGDSDLTVIAAKLHVTTAYLRGLVELPHAVLTEADLTPFERLVIAAQRLQEATDAVLSAIESVAAAERSK